MTYYENISKLFDVICGRFQVKFEHVHSTTNNEFLYLENVLKCDVINGHEENELVTLDML